MSDGEEFMGCPPPFLDERNYPATGGYLGGRSCGPSPLDENVNCCLPCPIEAWVYPESYLSSIRNINYLSILSFFLCAFTLISYLVLPKHKSHRHYLNVGLLCVFLPSQIALILPLAHTPDTCYNDITPRDMYSSGQCAVTGSCLVIGGIGAVVWVFLRALWTHIRVCWDSSPGRAFMYASIATGIAIPAIFLGAIIKVTGFSFRLGATCVPNHDYSFADFWGWMLAFAGLTGLMQLVTTGYCVWAYLRSLKLGRGGGGQARSGNAGGNAAARVVSGRSNETAVRSPRADDVGASELEKNESGAKRQSKISIASSPTSPNPLSPLSARAPPSSPRVKSRQTAWSEIRALLILQWRSICISFAVLLEIVFFAVVFIAQDAKTTAKSGNPQEIPAVVQWSTCLALTQGDRDICRPFTKDLVLPQSTVLAALVVVTLSGAELAALLIRRDTLRAWAALVRTAARRLLGRKRASELPLTSLDAPPPFPRRSLPTGTQDDEGGAHPLPPIPESAEHREMQQQQQQQQQQPHHPHSAKRDFGAALGQGARTSILRPWSWVKGGATTPTTPSMTMAAASERNTTNWPLPAEGLRSLPQEERREKDDNAVNSGGQAVSEPLPPWANEEKEEEHDGERAVQDPRALGRGGLGMNPVSGLAADASAERGVERESGVIAEIVTGAGGGGSGGRPPGGLETAGEEEGQPSPLLPHEQVPRSSFADSDDASAYSKASGRLGGAAAGSSSAASGSVAGRSSGTSGPEPG